MQAIRAAALTVLLAVSTSAFLAVGAQAIPIDVTVVETDGVARRNAPLTFGVPFGRGVLRDPATLTVREVGGAARPAQTRVTAHWPDGSARWVLVDTQVDVSALATRHLRVEPGRALAPAHRLVVVQSDDDLAIRTGALRFRIPKKHFGIVEQLQAEGGAVVAPEAMTALLAAQNGIGKAGTPQKVTVLESGPLRVRVELRGSYGNGFDYLIRVDAYAGQPFVRVLHTFINRSGAPFVTMPRLAVELPLAKGPAGTWAVGLEKGRPRSGTLGSDEVHFYQPDNLRFETGGEEEEGKLAGWIELRRKTGAVGLAARWFWQQYPQSMAAQTDRLTYNLWAPEAAAARVGMGAAKTHELIVWATRGSATSEDVAAAVRPLSAAVDANWIASSGALPQAVAPPGDGFVAKVAAAAERYRRRNDRERWDDRGTVHCKEEDAERPRTGSYGMWNFGDWNFPKYQDNTKGCDAWGNLEYDTTQVLALAFAAVGRPELREAMEAAARHFADVDVIHHYPPRPSWEGMNHPKNPLHFSFELGGVDLGHTWNEGLLSYYYLTGDERGLEAARGIADYLVSRTESTVRGNPRQWGWPQIALVAAYDATGEARYLEAARWYARGGMAAHPPTAVQKWKLGILADALAYTHGVTHDAAIEKWLRVYADAVMRRKGRSDPRLYPGVAYVATLGNDKAMRAAALARVQSIDLGSWGKPFTIGGRLGFRVLSLLAAPSAALPARTIPAGQHTRHDRPSAGRASITSPLGALRDADRQLGVALAPQQDVECAGAAVALAGAGEGEHEPRP